MNRWTRTVNVNVLYRRATYGGRKGLRAQRRLRDLERAVERVERRNFYANLERIFSHVVRAEGAS